MRTRPVAPRRAGTRAPAAVILGPNGAGKTTLFNVTVLHYGRVVADEPTETVRRDPRVTEIHLGTSDA